MSTDTTTMTIDFTRIPRVTTELPGEKSRKMLEEQKNLETSSVIYPKAFPFAIRKANGSVIEDLDGNTFIDWVTGISVLNLGFNDSIKKSIGEQLNQIWHTLEIPTETRINFLKAVRESFPSDMHNYKSVFGISGADACETAVNLAHSYSGQHASTIAFEGAYHGVSGGIVSATSGRSYQEPVHSIGFDVVRIPYPYPLWYREDVSDIISMIERIFKDPANGHRKPDSLIVEPIQGEGGYVVPPKGFLRAIRDVCDRYDLTMIVDEVQTGMGRTGKMWAFEWENVRPDIVCTGKSIGGGVPISLVYFREDMDEKLPTPFHLGTYRANPLATAAGTVVLKETPRYLERVRKDGQEIMKGFSEIESPLIGEVRGKGFMIGVELVENSMPLDKRRVNNMKHKLLTKGLMMHTCGRYSNVFRYMGALNIPDELNSKGMEIFSSVISGG